MLAWMTGVYRLMENLMYGAGMWLMERSRLRVKDVGFERREILIRDDKEAKRSGYDVAWTRSCYYSGR